jgi:hypothetical protein
VALGLIESMQHRILTVILSILFFGCVNSSRQNKDINSDIAGVWIYDYEINNLYLNDTSSFFKTPQPIVFDFNKSGVLNIKNFAYKDTILNWTTKNDSLLVFGGKQYSIFRLNEEDLTLVDFNRPDTFWTYFKRPIKTKIELSQNKVLELLLSKSWSIEEKNKRRWQTDFQFYDNGFMSYRYPILDRMINDSAINIQLEGYGVEKYKDYYFLYQAPDPLSGTGNNRQISQLLEIDSNSYSLIDFGIGKTDTLNYFGHSFSQPRLNEIKSKLIGKWHSQNTRDKTYGKYFPNELIESGEFIPFEGILTYKFHENDSVQILIDGVKYSSARWILGNDGNLILLEQTINDEYGKRVYLESINIMELENDILKVRLFDHNIFLEETSPKRTLLNIFQEFKKE